MVVLIFVNGLKLVYAVTLYFITNALLLTWVLLDLDIDGCRTDGCVDSAVQ